MAGIVYFFTLMGKYWGQFGEFMGNVVGRFFLMIFYLTIAAPFALIARLSGDQLQVRQGSQPAWNARDQEADVVSLESGYSQG